jgi:hypothetical protein
MTDTSSFAQQHIQILPGMKEKWQPFPFALLSSQFLKLYTYWSTSPALICSSLPLASAWGYQHSSTSRSHGFSPRVSFLLVIHWQGSQAAAPGLQSIEDSKISPEMWQEEGHCVYQIPPRDSTLCSWKVNLDHLLGEGLRDDPRGMHENGIPHSWDEILTHPGWMILLSSLCFGHRSQGKWGSWFYYWGHTRACVHLQQCDISHVLSFSSLVSY